MRSEWPGWKGFLKDMALRVGGAVGAIGLIFIMVRAGNALNAELLQSQGGVILSTILVGEALFLVILIYAAVRGDI